MPEPHDHTRVCPTRTDGAASLFAHRVTTEACQDKQRGRFHKCYTCAFHNAYVAEHGLPEPRTGQQAPAPEMPGPRTAPLLVEPLAATRAVEVPVAAGVETPG